MWTFITDVQKQILFGNELTGEAGSTEVQRIPQILTITVWIPGYTHSFLTLSFGPAKDWKYLVRGFHFFKLMGVNH